jgi:hypothetical protein
MNSALCLDLGVTGGDIRFGQSPHDFGAICRFLGFSLITHVPYPYYYYYYSYILLKRVMGC